MQRIAEQRVPVPRWPVDTPIPEEKLSRGQPQLRNLGIESTFHAPRHYFATSVYSASLDLRLTQDLMGHASPTTTAVYPAWDASKATDVIAGLEVPGARHRRAYVDG